MDGSHNNGDTLRAEGGELGADRVEGACSRLVGHSQGSQLALQVGQRCGAEVRRRKVGRDSGEGTRSGLRQRSPREGHSFSDRAGMAFECANLPSNFPRL